MQRATIHGQKPTAEAGSGRNRQDAGVDVDVAGEAAGAGQSPDQAADLVEGVEPLVLRGRAERADIEHRGAAAAELENIAAGAEHSAGDHRALRQRQAPMALWMSPIPAASAAAITELKLTAAGNAWHATIFRFQTSSHTCPQAFHQCAW